MRRSVFVLMVGVLASGCAGASIRGMTVTPDEYASPPSPVVVRSVLVGEVVGGDASNPGWWCRSTAPWAPSRTIDGPSFRSALVASLQAAGMLAEAAPATFTAAVSLLGCRQRIDSAPFALAITVTTDVRYTLTDGKGSTVLEERVEVAHTATAADAMSGTERARLAAETSSRKSIATFLARLNALQRSP